MSILNNINVDNSSTTGKYVYRKNKWTIPWSSTNSQNIYKEDYWYYASSYTIDPIYGTIQITQTGGIKANSKDFATTVLHKFINLYSAGIATDWMYIDSIQAVSNYYVAGVKYLKSSQASFNDLSYGVSDDNLYSNGVIIDGYVYLTMNNITP